MDSDPHIVPTVIAATVIAATALWLFVSQLRTRPRRPASRVATMDLGPEPPAVVDLLTDDFSVTPEAVPATLVDLAARRWLTIEEAGRGNVVIRLRTADRDEPLAPFERRVLDHLRSLSLDSLVPAAAMTTGPEGASKRWWRSFRREVVADAQRRGLSRDRWTKAMLAPIWIGVVSAGALLWLAMELGDVRDELDPPSRGGGLWLLVVFSAVGLGIWASTVLGRDLQRDTDASLDAASRWVAVRDYMATVGDFNDKPAAMVAVWDRYLAYAVALDLAPLVVAQLPLGAEDHRQTWSRASGRWRQVRVRYPLMRPGYGQHPLLALVGAAVAGAAALVVLRFAERVRRDEIDALGDATGGVARGIDIAAAVIAAVAFIVLAWNAVKLLMALADVVTTDVREGIVIRARVRRGLVGLTASPSTNSDDQTRERFYCAFDTGERPVVAAMKVRRKVFDRVRQGERYSVRVTPRLGYVRDVEPAAPSASPSP